MNSVARNWANISSQAEMMPSFVKNMRFLKRGPDERVQLERGTNAAVTNAIAANIRSFGPTTNMHWTWTQQWCGSRFVPRSEPVFQFFDITEQFLVHLWARIGHCFVCLPGVRCSGCNFFVNCSVFNFQFFHTPLISMQLDVESFLYSDVRKHERKMYLKRRLFFFFFFFGKLTFLGKKRRINTRSDVYLHKK